MRKFLASAVIVASFLGGVALTAGTATAAPVSTKAYVPAGVYPTMQSCVSAAHEGHDAGRWNMYRCEPLSDGQFLLWVE